MTFFGVFWNSLLRPLMQLCLTSQKESRAMELVRCGAKTHCKHRARIWGIHPEFRNPVWRASDGEGVLSEAELPTMSNYQKDACAAKQAKFDPKVIPRLSWAGALGRCHAGNNISFRCVSEVVNMANQFSRAFYILHPFGPFGDISRIRIPGAASLGHGTMLTDGFSSHKRHRGTVQELAWSFL
ncbi:hypothetical protein PV04_03085 [Phialophora macrospora]|uniref:Uncharacterized protein n=1 Tax=Phialophora macrospora TaxID=1851006 RepID=A0A0D2FR67_9EURO|nr:hypothetical protein PV04_03085 [Phialophora macrospora]